MRKASFVRQLIYTRNPRSLVVLAPPPLPARANGGRVVCRLYDGIGVKVQAGKEEARAFRFTPPRCYHRERVLSC